MASATPGVGTTAGADTSPGTAATKLHTLADAIDAYVSNPPVGDRYIPPIIDWHHQTDYDQSVVGGLTKFLHHVKKERAIVDELLTSSRPPAEYSTNLVSLQGVWEAFVRSPRPLVGIWQTIDRRPGAGGAGATKIDVVAAGGDEWVKVNTIKENRLLIEFREHDSYLNSDYDSDSEPEPELTNSLLTQARALVATANAHARLANLPPPRIRYVLTRLEEDPAGGHPDARIPETFAVMRSMGIELDFASTWGDPPASPPPPPRAVPAQDIILDLSVLIALCCDSTHYPLPTSDNELESRFRSLRRDPDGSIVLGPHSGTTRDLRDQLRCEAERPLIQELRDRLESEFGGAPVRFWATREVSERLPGLVNVIGGMEERARAKALFDPSAGYFWSGSRWEGNTGCLDTLRVGVLEDGDADGTAPVPGPPQTPFDTVVSHVCEGMLAAADESSNEGSRRPTPEPTERPMKPPKPIRIKPKKDRQTKKFKRGAESKSPLRPGTVFPSASRLPSGHTLRTLLAGFSRRATVLTNNRGAVLKVIREAGVTEGIPAADGGGAPRARIWVVNPSSLAEWRRIEVDEANARVRAGEEVRNGVEVEGKGAGGREGKRVDGEGDGTGDGNQVQGIADGVAATTIA